ncbi:MAG: hypothetical protein RLZZ200_2794 [Pseudomonadota bacterium]|jgi:flagella basal body P-ring formation protein FlgA
MLKRAALLLSIAMPLACPGKASAQVDAIQDLQALRAVVTGFASSRLGPQPEGTTLFVEPGPLDPRLHLAACAAPEAFLPQGAKLGTRFTVGIRCASPVWSVYLPVSVESDAPVLVLRVAAARGASVAAGDVDLQRRRVPGFANLYLSDPAQLAGRHLKQTAAPGTALTTDLLLEDIKVRRGQRVTLVASSGHFEVRAPGEAVADARPDGRVRVQNLSSGKIIEGSVESADTVRVGR